ncbi:hypothetical protein HCN44_007077 [Aphidius gifuensis]|uniref:PPM-type phosphatase domain-containing protein n=1 Tax=Aphidius gifuensis TaxID=684658 RepID=A0A834XKX3_APHGI|nr:uncharacterized protein LOC122857457 [Aphidius gifuensis]XP_044015565.1 uncharacterized protein LOC122857457 [Aphidius gifuensis]XP_044015566.1 uncharacterized protein LOC122857457 [Aphidius gifuensis]KAF7988767.1 hypothetical protein HCN44_007077 [Aphidius gifuensis]
MEVDGDYLGAYRRFFADFIEKVNPDDQLPVRTNGSTITEGELVGVVIDITLQYLNQKFCPPSLQSYIVRIVIEEMKTMSKLHPDHCGRIPQKNIYTSMKLMRAVTGKINDICQRYLESNSRLALLPPPPSTPLPLTTVFTLKNGRRTMEDRYVILHDLNTMFNIKDDRLASYYAVFDGHAGQDAAVYCAAHLHQYLAESNYYPTDPERALRDAFVTTDAHFVDKSNRDKLNSGATAVCTLIIDKKLYVAWAGDSQAALAKSNEVIQLVNPHRPERMDERERVERMGGSVIFFGVWRVNGHLGVSRAIGDIQYKPYVTSDPDIVCVDLDGTEDFLIVACDGLWDVLDEDTAAGVVYEQLCQNPYDLELISRRLVDYSKKQGSSDNITVIIIFLTPPCEIIKRSYHCPQIADIKQQFNMEQDNKYVSTTNGQYDMNTDTMKNTKIHDNGDNYDIEGVDKKINGKHDNNGLKNYIVDDDDDDDNDDDDDDFGPETNVDAVDDACEISSSNINKVLFPDNDLIKQQKSSDVEIDDKLEIDDNKPKEKNEAVGDADNVVESEDSDDEWNYYRADTSNNKKVELSSSTKSVELNIDNNSDIEKLKIDVDKKIDDTVTDDNLSEKIDFKKEIEQQIEEKEAVSSSIDNSSSSSDNSSSSEDECDKENLPPVKLAENNTNVSHQLEESLDQIPETFNLTQQESEDMEFQLNPNAAEFIPVSPVPSVPSVPMLPIHHNDVPITGSPVSPGSPVQMLPAHLRDAPISGSPLKPTAIMDDIRLPSPEEFNNEASHRPGEIDEKSLSNLSTPTNGNESPNLSSYKNLDKQKLLFDLDESEVSSTRAEFGDESTASYLTTNDLQKTGVFDGSFTSSFISNHEIDPMMMSFGPGDFNPLTKTVDLNAVHDLDDTDLIGESDTSRNGNGNYRDKDDDDDDDDDSDSVNHPELTNLRSPDIDHYKNTQTFPVDETDIMFNRSIPVCNLNREEYTVTDDISNQVAAMNLANSQQSSNIFYNKNDDNDDNNDVVNVDVEEKNNDNKIEEKHYDNDDFMMSCDASKNIENNADMIEQVDLMSSNNENELQHEQMDLMSSNNDDNFNENIINSQETLMTPEKVVNHEKSFGFESNADLLADEPVNSSIDTPVDLKTIDDEKLEIKTEEINTIHKVEEENIFKVSEKIPDIVSNTPEIVEKETQIFENIVVLEEQKNQIIENETQIIENIPSLEEQKNQMIENKTIVEEKLSEIIENGSTMEEEKCPVIKNTPVEEKILENVELPQTNDETSSKIVENIIEKIPVDNLLANITEEKTVMKLSESLQEFTGLENEFIPSDKEQTQLPIENIDEKSKDNETTLPTKENDKIIDIKNNEKPIKKTSASSSSAAVKVEPKAKSVNAVKLPASKTTLKVTKTDVKTSLKASPTSPSKTTVTAKTSGTVGVASKKPITRPKTVDASSKTLTATSAKPSVAKLSTTAIKSPTTKPVSTSTTTTLKSKTLTSAPRPSTLSTKTADKKVATTNGDATKTGTLKPKPASRPLVKPPTAASRPATATTTTTKPRVPSTVSSTKPLTTKSTDVKIQRPKTAPTTLGIASKTTRVSTLTKSPVIDKQIKETANKQISNRTSTMTKTTRTTTTTASTLTARRTTATATATVKTTSEKKAVTTRISAKSATAVAKNQQQKKAISKVITKTEIQNGNCEIKDDNNVVIQEAIVNEVTELKKDPISFPDTTDNQLLITAD